MNMSTDQRRAMGKAGRKWVEDNFDRNKVVDLYIEEINRIAKL
jgi:galacturonosyltransferase